MLKHQKIFLAVLIGTGVLSSCSTPNNISNNKNNEISTNKDTISNSINVSQLNIAKVDLAALHDDDDVFNDSEVLINNSFSVKSEDDKSLEEQEVEEEYNLVSPPPPKVNANARVLLKTDINKFIKENAKKIRDEFKNLKDKPIKDLEGAANLSAAMTINDDGTITIDSKKLQSDIKNVLEKRKEKLKDRLANIKDSLKDFRSTAKDKIKNIRKRDNDIKNTNKVVTQNDDGTTTETMKFEFNNEKRSIKRENTISKTLKDDKVIAIDHSLVVTTNNYTRSSSRVVTFNEDGSRVVKTHSITEWKDGKKVERSVERLVSSDRTFTASGTVIVTTKDGKIKNYNLNMSKAISGEILSSIKDNDTNQEVQINQNENSTTEIVTSKDGSSEEKEINLEAAITII